MSSPRLSEILGNQAKKTMECPICYDVINEGESTRTPCGHTFHVTCMTSWLERATTCPSCRTRVSAAPSNPDAEPPWQGFEDRHQRLEARRAALRAGLASIAERLVAVKADLEAHEAARKAKRSAAAKRGAATRAANKARAVTHV